MFSISSSSTTLVYVFTELSASSPLAKTKALRLARANLDIDSHLESGDRLGGHNRQWPPADDRLDSFVVLQDVCGRTGAQQVGASAMRASTLDQRRLLRPLLVVVRRGGSKERERNSNSGSKIGLRLYS
jgi:hypothetical protein